ncbi:MAG: fimbria/pilus outer membrane usher protein [Sulfurospirillaceae bacterium]|nr:fimbria/pilus outer membrane usher protein [Sulfurospirillaceae bacterium]
MKHLTKAFLFLPIFLFAEPKVLDLFVGTEQIGTFLFTQDNGKYIADDNITFGKCSSKNLSDLGVYQESDEKLFLKPKRKCLSKEVLSFRQQKKKYFKDSTSAFLNYSIAQRDTGVSATLGSGVFAYNTLFYTQGTLSDKQENKLENYFILKEFEKKKLKLGSVYAVSGSYLTAGYALEGVQISPNKAMVQNGKTFDYQLVINDQSTVEIYNNDQIIQKLTLNAGIYNLRDLPISHFSNNIKIVVTDSFGNAREIDVPFLYNQNILAKDSIDYDFAIGKDEKQKMQYSGFYRKGITDNLTVGFAFDTNRTALTADYLSTLGKLGLQIDNKKNAAIDYSYSSENYYIGAMQILKDKKSDFRINAGVSGGFGNISLQFHTNAQTLFGVSYSKMLWKNLNLSINANFNNTDHTYNIGARFVWNFDIGSRRTTLTYANTSKDDGQSKYIATSMPIEDEHKGFGYEASYSKQTSDLGYTSDTYKASLKAKYQNNFWFNAQKISDQTTWDLGISGSIGCVVAEGINCGFGDVIYPASSYLLEDKELKRIPSYWTTDVKNKFTSTPVTLKSGQGYWLDPSLYKTITGTIKVNGKPYNEKTFKVGDKEYFTGFDGEFWIDGFIGKYEDFIPQIPNTSCKVNFMNKGKEPNEVQINCQEKRK